MGHSLPHLHLGSPGVRSPSLLAVVALLVRNYELNGESLLKNRVLLHFLLDCELHFQASAVGLRVDKLGVQKFDAF